MPVLTAPAAPTHTVPGTAFTSLATPSRGSTDTSVWQVEVAPGTAPTPHSLTREEVFVVLAGTASVRLDDTHSTARAGDAIVVPAGVRLELSNAGADPLRLLCCMPTDGRALLDDGTLLAPPWAQ